MPKRPSASMRRVIANRARGYCEYCRCPEQFATQSFTVEHIKPQQAGGKTVLNNLAWSCFGCNAHKHTKTQATDPQTGEIVVLYNPRQQIWSEHFSWSDNDTRVVGKTSCGRATIEALHLNRLGIVNLRRLLRSANLHPPEDAEESS